MTDPAHIHAWRPLFTPPHSESLEPTPAQLDYSSRELARWKWCDGCQRVGWSSGGQTRVLSRETSRRHAKKAADYHERMAG